MTAPDRTLPVSTDAVLPTDQEQAILLGRIWDTETGGPRPVLVHGDRLLDLHHLAPTAAQLLNLTDLTGRLAGVAATGGPGWVLEEVLAATVAGDSAAPRLLAPVDLQPLKACGVTFVDSMIERVIEERCAGDVSQAAAVRTLVRDALGGDLSDLRPGSQQAARVKEVLIAKGLWSPYLEVGIGPDPEVFTKGPVLSGVGYGSAIGIPRFSSWNNPEPELVLIVDRDETIRGCTLGNDVNLRDVEGRSALLLGMAKDNNASAALGPFIRLFDDTFTLDDARKETIQLTVEGPDGYLLEGVNSVARLSRPFEELVNAAHGDHHQYPDGFALFTGTLFAPNQDRDEPGMGFTHRHGDIVRIHSSRLGTLANTVGATEELPPWSFGLGDLLEYLVRQRAAVAPSGRGRPGW